MKTKLLKKEKNTNHFYNEFGKFNYGKVSNVLIKIIIYGLISQFIFLIYNNIFSMEFIIKNIDEMPTVFLNELLTIYSSLSIADYNSKIINIFLLPVYVLVVYLILLVYMFYKSKQQLKLSTLGLENYSLKTTTNGYILKLTKGEEVDFEYIQKITDDVRQIFKIKENKRIVISRYKSNDVKVEVIPILKSFDFDIKLLKKGFIYFGKNSDNNHIQINVNKLTHYLIAGASGSGKSVLQNLIINNLIYNYKYIDSLYLVDLKNGVEFNKYNKILSNISVIEDLTSLYNITNKLIELMTQRYALIKENDTINLLPIVVFIDEYASIEDMAHILDKDIYDKLKNNLKTLLAKSRAANIKFFIATQKATSDSIDTTLRNNLQSKILMKTSSKDAQRVVISDINEIINEFGINVSKFSQGQYVFIDESTQYDNSSVVQYMQSPLIENNFFKNFMHIVKRNKDLSISIKYGYFTKLLITYNIYKPKKVYFRNRYEMNQFYNLKEKQSIEESNKNFNFDNKDNNINLEDEVILRKELYKLAIKYKLKDEAKDIRIFIKQHDDNLSCLSAILKMKNKIESKVKMETKP